MRSKLNGTLVLALFGLFSVATACGDDGTNNPGGGDAGEAGEVGAGGSGGPGSGGSNTAGKSGGTAGNGGTSAGNGAGGDPATNGGYPSSDGGTSSGNGGESGSGTEPMGNGGESGGGGDPSGSSGAGGEGGAGPVGCTEITLGLFDSIVTADFAKFPARFNPNIGGGEADTFHLSIMKPPYEGGEDTGTFDLTENGDENYATCVRCFIAAADDNTKFFYPSEGTLTIEEGSTQLTGTLSATITNLKLVEVTLAPGPDYTSTPVPNGECLTVASATIEAPAVLPGEWTCDEEFYGDNGCDCGCGALDIDCRGTTDASECDYCEACTGNFSGCPAAELESNDTTQCAD